MPQTPNSTLDHILSIQLNIAWAGESDGEPERLNWWRCDLSAPASGGDFLARLLPQTWTWAALIAIRKAAAAVDAERRVTLANADHYLSIFNLGPALNERLDERLNELRTANLPPHQALPELLFKLHTGPGCDEDSAFDPQDFSDWLTSMGTASHKASPAGRLLVGDTPPTAILVERLSAMLLQDGGGFATRWPFPHAHAQA